MALSCTISTSIYPPSRSVWPISFTSELFPCDPYLQEAALPTSHSSQVSILLFSGQLWDAVVHSLCVNSKPFQRAILHPASKESAQVSAPGYVTLTFSFSWVSAVYLTILHGSLCLSVLGDSGISVMAKETKNKDDSSLSLSFRVTV